MKYLKKNLTEFVAETIHNVAKSRRVLASRKDNKNLEAITNAFLHPKQKWDWHKHEQIDEVAIVLKGKGVFGLQKKLLLYKTGDVITIPSGNMHKWEALDYCEFIFIRVRVV